MTDINELLSNLSASEYEATVKILEEVSDNGTSNTLSAIYNADYDEMPVSIDEFIESDNYAGWFTNNGAGIYPYWRERLREIFDGDSDEYNEIVYTGCLSGDTLIVLTNNRVVPIRELANTNNINDYVFSYDVNNKQYTIGHLIMAFSTGIKDTYIIYTDNGSIRATSNHQFLDNNGRWVSIDNSNLKSGCHLMNDIVVTNIEYYGQEEVYDLTIDTYHNFMLGNGIIAHNSIGSGKSHIAVLSLAYHLYRVMCLSDPYKYFNLAKGSKMYIVFFNTTLALSQGVAYTKFQALLQNSPWFMRHGRLSGNKYIEYIPDKNIVFSTGSQMEHSLGKDIIGTLMDEINFAKGEDPQMEKSKIMKTYSCLEGNTRILTDEYGIMPIKDLVDIGNVKVFSHNDNGSTTISNNTYAVNTKNTKELIEIETEDGTIIKVTPEHKLRLSSGEYKEAQYLTETDILAEIIEHTNVFNIDVWRQFDIDSEKLLQEYLDNMKSIYLEGIRDINIIEYHHVMPKSFMINDFKIALTPEEHYNAHKILMKCFKGKYKAEMCYAFSLMTDSKNKTSALGDYAEAYRTKSITSSIINEEEIVSEETRERMSEDHIDFREETSIYGRISVRKGSIIRRVKEEELNDYINNGYEIELSEEEEERVKSINIGLVHINNGTVEKCIHMEDFDLYMNDGYELGSLNDRHSKNCSTYGKTIVHRDNSIKFILKSELQSYLDDGFEIGTGQIGSTINKTVVNNGINNKFISIDNLGYYLDNGYSIGMIREEAQT